MSLSFFMILFWHVFIRDLEYWPHLRQRFLFLEEDEEWVYAKGLKKETHDGLRLERGAWDVTLIATLAGPGQSPLKNVNQSQIIKGSFTCHGINVYFVLNGLSLLLIQAKN